MAIKMIPLSRLEADLKTTLDECAESGQTLVVELSGQRFLAISPLDLNDNDTLVDDLLEHNPGFQALVVKSKAGPRKPFRVERAATNS